LAYADGMATIFDQIEELKIEHHPIRPGGKMMPVIAGVVVGLVLGYLGWVLPTPGGSFLIPTLIVAGAGILVLLVGGLFALHLNHQSLWVFCVTVLVLTIAASIWTFAFSMPASVAWDANATHEAQVVLARVNAEPKTSAGIPIKACWTVRQGSIGSLRAPYSECGVSTREGHYVTFGSIGYNGGLGYTDRGAATFPDACSRHLTGEWWVYRSETNGEGGCPVGYRFQGGP
jgi:hypothetical protein